VAQIEISCKHCNNRIAPTDESGYFYVYPLVKTIFRFRSSDLYDIISSEFVDGSVIKTILSPDLKWKCPRCGSDAVDVIVPSDVEIEEAQKRAVHDIGLSQAQHGIKIEIKHPLQQRLGSRVKIELPKNMR